MDRCFRTQCHPLYRRNGDKAELARTKRKSGRIAHRGASFPSLWSSGPSTRKRGLGPTRFADGRWGPKKTHCDNRKTGHQEEEGTTWRSELRDKGKHSRRWSIFLLLPLLTAIFRSSSSDHLHRLPSKGRKGQSTFMASPSRPPAQQWREGVAYGFCAINNSRVISTAVTIV